MRGAVRAPKSNKQDQHQQQGRSPNRSALAAESGSGPVSVNAPLLQSQQTQYNTQGLDAEHAYQQQKVADIHEVEASSREVQGLFEDFRILAEAQQEPIDTVERNVDKSNDHVVKGTDQLKKASETQKCSRKIMCIFLCVIVVIIAIVMIALVAMKKVG